MKHLFVDTNVLIDFLANRKPFSLEAATLFNFALQKRLTIYVAAVSFNNIYYILRQSCSHSDTLHILSELEEWTTTVDVSKEVIKKSLQSDFKDFEDAIQYHCAKTIKNIDGIVTRNRKDFKTSILAVFTPKEALSLIES